MATVEDIAVAALAVCADLEVPVGGARSVLYRRASVRQQQLFSEAAKRNPEYFGAVALGTLVNGAVDIDTMPGSGVPACESVYLVLIGDKGTSSYADDDEVAIVSVRDGTRSALAPRVTIQDRVIRQLATDLAGVSKLKVYYSRSPAEMSDEADEVELPVPFEELLVLDLAVWLVKSAVGVPEARKVDLLATLGASEKAMEQTFFDHLRSFSQGYEGRFGGVR